MYAMRREPHQPEAKPPVVHTDMSVDYNDTTTTRAIDNMLEGAEDIQPTKKEPIMGKRTRQDMKLPMGEQGATVANVITEYAVEGEDITPTLVWSWLDPSTKERWEQVYGGHKKAYDKLRHAMSNLSYSGKLRLVPSAEQKGAWTYLGEGRGKPRGARALKSSPPELPASTPEGDLGDYKHVGTDLDGLPLYHDQLTGEFGTLTFTPIS